MKYTKKNYKRKYHSKKVHNQNYYKILNPNDIDKYEFKIILKKIFAKNEKLPLLGYFTNDNIIRKLDTRHIFLVFKSNLFIGIVFFKNLTREFKKSILGSTYINDDSFKSNSDVNNYLINWIFLYGELDKALFDTIINKFRKGNNLLGKNIIITALKFSKNTKQNEDITNDVLFKYKPIVDYKNTVEYEKLTNLGFTYNDYHISMHNEITNIYSIRFLNELTRKDFFPMYIITRQLKNEYAINLNGIKSLLHTDKITTINNIKRFSLDNTLLFYTNRIDNEVYSVNSSIPYKFNFVMNYITNNLGNSHIVKKYSNLYYAIINDKDIQTKDLKYFCEVITSYDKALELLDKKQSSLILTIFPIKNYDIYLSINFSDKKTFEDYIIKNENKVLYGYYLRNFTFMNKRISLKNDNYYYLAPYMLLTYVNNVFKCYIYSSIGFLIFKEKYNTWIENFEYDNLEFLVRPQKFNESFNEYSSRPINLDNIYMKIRKLCGLIGKAYKKHVSLNINQIHGFVAIHPMICLIEENGEIYPKLFNINQDATISNSENITMSEWIYDLAIRPAIEPNFICKRTELHYQPLNIE